MISIVVVSHSRALAQAALALAQQMVPDGQGPRVSVAAGLDDTTLGTDAGAIAAALEEVDGPDGTLVLLDLGSAILSAEMALEFVDEQVAARVRISPAPLVEGLVTAMVQAAAGQGLDEVDAEARRALAAKTEQLGTGQDEGDEGHEGGEPERDAAPAGPGGSASPGSLSVSTVLGLPHGLHARPAAALVAALTGWDAEVSLAVAGRGWRADARSITALAGLGARQGDELVATISGPDADQARAAFLALAERNFDEAPEAGGSGLPTAPDAEQPAGLPDAPVFRMPLDIDDDLAATNPGSVEQEQQRLAAAITQADAFLAGLADAAADAPGQRETAGVLAALRALLRDPALAKEMARAIAAGKPAEVAVAEALGAQADTLQAMDSAYLRERSTDLRALARLLRAALAGRELGLPEVPAGAVVQVTELDAVVAAQLDGSRVAGVHVVAPGELGHGVLVARSRGLRVVTGPR